MPILLTNLDEQKMRERERSCNTTMKVPFIFFSVSRTLRRRKRKKNPKIYIIHAYIDTTYILSYSGCFLASYIYTHIYIYIHIHSVCRCLATDADNHTSASIRRLHINVVFINIVLSYA